MLALIVRLKFSLCILVQVLNLINVILIFCMLPSHCVDCIFTLLMVSFETNKQKNLLVLIILTFFFPVKTLAVVCEALFTLSL